MVADSSPVCPDVVGVDIGRYRHHLACLTPAGDLQWERPVDNTTAALSALVEYLQTQPQPLVVALETQDANASLLVRLLHAQHIPVLTCPPYAVKAHRRGTCGEDKDDRIDAGAIADFARQGRRVYQAVSDPIPGRDSLRLLSKEAERLTVQSTAIQNRLQELVISYLPDVITGKCFSDPCCPTAIKFYRKYLPLARLRTADQAQLAAALRGWSRGHARPEAAPMLIEAARLSPLPEAQDELYRRLLENLLDELEDLRLKLKQLRLEIEALIRRDPAGPELLAERGLGVMTVAVMLGAIPSIAAFGREAAFARYCGLTPRKDSSGRREGRPRLSRQTNKRLLNAFYMSSLAAVSKAGPERDYYQRRCQQRPETRKTTHLIALSRKRCRRVYRLLKRCEQGEEVGASARLGFIALGAVGTSAAA
jgi:transposase